MGCYTFFALLAFATNQMAQLDPTSHFDQLVSGSNGYLHKITLGSNNKEFVVMVSMRSSLLWIPNANCTGSCESKRKFNSSESRTFASDGREWTLKGYGGEINGVLGIDTIKDSSGKLAISNGTFGMATKVSAEVNLPEADGILGLAYKDTGTGTPFIMQLINGRFIHKRNGPSEAIVPLADTDSETENTFYVELLDSDMFTIHLKQHSQIGENAGSVTYGAEDSTNCMTNITYQRFSPIGSYQIQVKSITMGKFNYTKQVSMLPDTIPFISVPKTVADQIANSIGAKLINGSYEIGCNVTIPDLEFSTEKTKFTISSEVLVVKKDYKCILALSSSSDAKWYFGAPLFKQYCVTFNIKKSNLGLASIKCNYSTTSSTRRTFNSTTPRNITQIASSSTRRTFNSTTPRNITRIASSSTQRFFNSTIPRNITVLPFSSTRTSNTTSLPVTTTTKSSTSALYFRFFSLICSLVFLF